jgi:hypothetical protein
LTPITARAQFRHSHEGIDKSFFVVHVILFWHCSERIDESFVCLHVTLSFIAIVYRSFSLIRIVPGCLICTAASAARHFRRIKRVVSP